MFAEERSRRGIRGCKCADGRGHDRFPPARSTSNSPARCGYPLQLVESFTMETPQSPHRLDRRRKHRPSGPSISAKVTHSLGGRGRTTPQPRPASWLETQ